MNALSPALQSLFSVVMALMLILALALLWRRDRSVWLLVALAAETIGLVFRIVLTVIPDVIRTAPMLFSVWTLTALAFALGLLGYAIEASAKR
ncbi:hypothetical protein [Dokdonella sp.]|uniref:hypothetical protein n=1 Tax=Dokdonella sp. TaxID=2291710 RepID=UPI00378455E2